MRGGAGHQDGVSKRWPSNLNSVTTMKTKTLTLALLGMVGWFLGTNDAGAFWRCRDYSVIKCRPYNAFTPLCWGNMTCDGCCPFAGCGGGGCCPSPIQSCLPIHQG